MVAYHKKNPTLSQIWSLWLYIAELALEDWIVDFKEDLWPSNIEFFHFIVNNIMYNTHDIPH